jgi:hypothetical protein
MITSLCLAAGLLAAAHAAAQQPVYKSIDADGHVTYSSTPPPGAAHAEAVELPPPPAPTEIEAAQQRAQALQERGEQAYRQRAERAGQLAQERPAAREEEARRQAAESPPEVYSDGGYGWAGPVYPGYLPPHVRPPWPERPFPPPPNHNPGTRPDHPAFWPREPVPPGPVSPQPQGGLRALPPPRSDRPR